MKHRYAGLLVVLVLFVIAAPVMAGDCIKLKNGKWKQPGPKPEVTKPTQDDYDNSPYSVTSENYDKITFSMKIGNAKPMKQTLDTAKVEKVFFNPFPPAYRAAAELMNAGDYPGAIGKFQALANDRQARSWVRILALMDVARIHEAGGNLPGILGAWEKLAKDFPKSRYVPKAFIQIGLTHLANNDVKAAKASFARLGRLAGLPPGQKMLAQYYLILIKQKQGEAAKNQSMLRQALSEYRSLLNKSENNEELKEVAILARLGIGTCLRGVGQYDEALAFFQKIADSAKDPAVLAGAFNGLGNCYYKKNQWKDALLAFLRVEVLYDEDPEQTAHALLNSGRCFAFMSGSGLGEDSKLRAKMQFSKCFSRFPGTSIAQQAREESAALR
jgi:tetratricopeptide (TPR) repeat protein